MLWKDVLFSYFLMFTCFLVKILIDKDEVNGSFIILFAFVMACTAQLRYNGLILIIILLIVLSAYLYKKDKSKRVYIAVPALTVIFILLIASLNVVYDVEDNQKDTFYTKVVHLLSDYDLYLDLSNDDGAKIHKVIPRKNIEKFYSATYSDPAYFNSNYTAYANNKMDYISMAVKYSILNPVHFVKYLFDSSPWMWKITRDSDWSGSVYNTNVDKIKEYFYNQGRTPEGDFDNVSIKNSQKDYYNKLNEFVNNFNANSITQTLFMSPAFTCIYLLYY